MTDFDHMPNYGNQERLGELRVLTLSGAGILLQDPRSGMFTVAWNPLIDCFELHAVPAWPDGAQEAVVEILAEIYDEEGQDLWLRAAALKGWDHETALQRAEALRTGTAT